MNDRRYTVQFRKRVVVCTDPQKRCYNGQFASSEIRWTDWEDVYTTTLEDAKDAIETFTKINGKSREYRIREIK